MIFEGQSKNKKNLFIIFAVLLLGGISYLVWPNFSNQLEPVYCTQEEKLCPDGSYVGRTGPNCEFAKCPGDDGSYPLKTLTDPIKGVSFQYPESLTAEYIHTVDWPPQVQILDGPLVCTEAGSETARAGKTEKRMVDNRTYCVTEVLGAAAGSIYRQYAYAFQKDAKVVILTFSLQYPQCVNYDDPQKAECQNERETFDIDRIIDRIVRTLTLTASGNIQKSSGIKGMVLLGPTCPVERFPPDPQCADKPYATTLVLTSSDQSRVIREFKSDTNGRFSVDVQPGEYVIRSAAAANILPYCSNNETIKVIASAYTEATVYCDTGIR